MEQKLTDEEKSYLNESYSTLIYVENKNIIAGVLAFDLTYNNVRIKDKYHIEITLKVNANSILPKVKETKNRILKISKRKKVSTADLHLNNDSGELCLIIPLKEKERYPNGFELKEFLKHIEEHLYWVSFYERYEKPPWKDQAHGFDGYIQLYHENNSYRPEIKKMVERLIKKPISRTEFRKFIRNESKKL